MGGGVGAGRAFPLPVAELVSFTVRPRAEQRSEHDISCLSVQASPPSWGALHLAAPLPGAEVSLRVPRRTKDWALPNGKRRLPSPETSPAPEKTIKERAMNSSSLFLHAVKIGAEVRGSVDGTFDSGYLMTARVNGLVLRGVLFAPVSFFFDLLLTWNENLPWSHLFLPCCETGPIHLHPSSANPATGRLLFPRLRPPSPPSPAGEDRRRRYTQPRFAGRRSHPRRPCRGTLLISLKIKTLYAAISLFSVPPVNPGSLSIRVTLHLSSKLELAVEEDIS